MNLESYDYHLPEGLIAQEPSPERDRSRLMVLGPGERESRHAVFADLPQFIAPPDMMVVNDTRVFPARLIGRRRGTGGEAEILLLRERDDRLWEALCRPAKRLREGAVVEFDDGGLTAEIVAKGDAGHVTVRLTSADGIREAIDRIGRTPLPPYIRRDAAESDRERYQTVYARERGSVAAPTAGLHFSPRMLDELAENGVPVHRVTLHVGIDTFRPLTETEAAGNRLHGEYCRVPRETVDAVRECRAAGGRVFAVGTTTARALESASSGGEIEPFEGWTAIFIKPPYRFRSVDVLVTNFHLPRSSLLMMVSAFAGRERILRAYGEAVRMGYRFYSYGDAMLIFGGSG